MTRTITTLVLAGGVTLLLGTGTASGRPTSEQRCQAGKNQAAGKYAYCRQKAEAQLVTKGNAAKYAQAILDCSYAFAKKCLQLESSAARAGAMCPDEPLDQTLVQAAIDECTANVATALGGGGLSDCAADLGTVNAGTAVQADVLAGKTFSSAAGLGLSGTMPDNGAVTITPGTAPQAIAAGYHNGAGTVAGDADLVPGNIKSGVDLFGVSGTFTGGGGGVLKTGETTSYGPASDGDLQKGVNRSYTDNGDGTITDNTTGLMWEKNSDDDSIHDKDNTYTWGMTSSPYTMNGTMVTTFLATLNGGGGFAGHTDWRIPNRFELESLGNLGTYTPAVSPPFNTACAPGCTVLTCSCTAQASYWSSTTYAASPSYAWLVYFYDGYVTATLKDSTYHVRAVRGGS